jgi:hypothetical protein
LTRFVKIQPGHSLPIAKTKLRALNHRRPTYTGGTFLGHKKAQTP